VHALGTPLITFIQKNRVAEPVTQVLVGVALGHQLGVTAHNLLGEVRCRHDHQRLRPGKQAVYGAIRLGELHQSVDESALAATATTTKALRARSHTQ